MKLLSSEYKEIKLLTKKIKFDTLYPYNPCMQIYAKRKGNKPYPYFGLNRFKGNNGYTFDMSGFHFFYEKYKCRNIEFHINIYLEDNTSKHKIINLKKGVLI